MTKRGSASPPNLPGYSYTRPLGSGGFADVFLYEQDMPRRIVAVKVLADDAINPEVLRNFNAEVDILAKLSTHPSIVTIMEASISADGRPYFVMEYCPDNMGARYKKGALSVADVLDTGVRMAGALETAHRADLLHRDIKPSNILITSLGASVLSDFGIAGAAKSDETPGFFAMSVPWSAPEVLEETTAGTIQSEIWGLGATLYTLLAARSPFELPSGERIPREQLRARILRSKYVSTGRDDVDDRLDAVLMRTMEKSPNKRYASMVELAEQLRHIQVDLGLPVTTLEVAAAEWASASGGIDFSSDTPRGPVISTVNTESRRAARAKQLASAQRLRERSDKDSARLPSKRSGLVNGLIGAGAAVAIVILLIATGVI